MASSNGRLPAHASVSSFTGSDDGDLRRLQPTLSNTGSEIGRHPSRVSEGSVASQQSNYSLESSRYHQAQKPINDAVTSAFNESEKVSTASIPPEFLHQLTSQITANVLQQLKASNLPLPTQQPPMPNFGMDTSSSTGGSPPLDRATVYTPPSPHRNPDELAASQPSPQFPPPSHYSTQRNSSPGPDRRAVSPLSQTGAVSDNDANPSRPRGPRRISTGGDATILERVWGQLFTEQGQATLRLGQFLRGIAVHLIECYEPKHSLVITPAKLQRYYEETKLPTEVFPWKIVFDDRTSSISRMFREIECEHHLVQEKLSGRPDLPGLTPKGFETWATLLLKAHPDQEFERLAKTALDMPISNPDEKKERFPKELSRRLFPTRGDTEVVSKLQKIMAAHCNVTASPRESNGTEAQPRSSVSSTAGDEASIKTTVRSSLEKPDSVATAVPMSMSFSQASIERERQPYSRTHAESVTSDDTENTEDVPTPQPIERERKPYVAAPGGGKTHDNLDKLAGPSESQSMSQAPKSGRSSSVHASNKPVVDSLRSGPPPIAIHQRPPPASVEIPESRHRATNAYYRDAPRSGRNRSPSMSKENGAGSYVRRTEPDASYMSSSHHSDHHDEARRYKDYEAGRERLANDRYDAARMSAYDPLERARDRDRDRDGRPRMQSISNAGGGFVDGPRSPTMRTSAPTNYPASLPAGDEEYYLNRVPTAPTHYNGHNPPASISTGFQPPPPPSLTREVSSSVGRDTSYVQYPASAGYPPSSYRDGR